MSGLRADGPVPLEQAVTISFEGQPITARRGETLAAALTAAGIRDLRETAEGERRGIFCGMGVCQECLVNVDGVAAVRACMTTIERPVAVTRQGPLASLRPSAASTVIIHETRAPDILVIGAGAAGLQAAIHAARAGARVLIIDERAKPGGQFYKQPVSPDRRFADAQFAAGAALIAAADHPNVAWLANAEVWGAFPPCDFRIRAPGLSIRCTPRRAIIATGACERPWAVPGWTLPGVMTAGAAQTLLRSYRVLAGRRVLIAGNGPLNFQVAAELAKAGAEVVAVAEQSARPGIAQTLAAARMLVHSPALTIKGLALLRQLQRRNIPVLYRHRLASVEASGGGLRARLTGAGEVSFEADAVILGYGFQPSQELMAALQCEPAVGPGQTSAPGISAAGDCTGLGGAQAAEAQGIIAGLAAAASLGFEIDAGLVRMAERQLKCHRAFQKALWTVFAVDPLSAPSPGTIICRCEGLTQSALSAGREAGYQDINALKRLTRAGMGRCQGRYCRAPMQESQASPAGFTVRPPVKPVRIGEIV